MDTFLNLILALGYILAVPALFIIIPGFRKTSRSKPSGLVMAAEVLGTGLIVIGWLGLGNYMAVLINATWLVFISVYWWRRQSGEKAD
ncbi:MAG: hypothetical protein JWP00_558 [Chloroflexi bacterium]|jgi:hypothetical protein|nr:hypothetical protein [Chloroflexota bacterium]